LPNGGFYLIGCANRLGDEFDAYRLVCGFDFAEKIVEKGSRHWVEHDGSPGDVRRHFLDKLGPLSD
jgi:hypothetical protein